MASGVTQSSGGPLGQLSELVGAQTAAVKLLVSILLGFPLALIHRRMLYGKPQLHQHIFFTLSGLIIGYWNYDWTILHTTVAIVFTYAVLFVFRGSTLSIIVTFVFNMGYLLVGYYKTNTEDYDIKWTMPQCVLTLRLIGLAFDVSDGQKPESQLSSAQKLSALREFPSFLEVTAFGYFPGSFLIGPQFSLKRYRDYVNLKLMPNNPRDPDGNFIPPDCLIAGFTRAAIGFVYVAIFQIGTIYVSDQYLLSEDYRNLGFFKKVFLMGIWGRINLYKYISCWLITEGVCTAFGITYNGTDKNGNAKWDGCTNVKLLVFENGTEMNDYIVSFNSNTNYWCAEYIYKRVKFLGSKTYSQISVLLFLAIWHGLHSGYYMCFFLEFVIMACERDAKTFLLKHDKVQSVYNSNILVKYFVYIILRFYTLISMGYSLVPFVLLSYSRYMKVYSSMYFFGHIVFISYLIGAPYLKKSLRPRREERQHNE